MEYITIKDETSAQFVEKRSRFIGYIKPVSDEQDAVDFISAIRSKHWDATHNVYAYCLRRDGICRYSDDGEPSGTAGMPVLSVMTKGGITDCVIVVTRYFGGILLGGGGLVRAYSHSAALAVEAAGQVIMKECCNCVAVCDYSSYGKAAALVSESGGVIDDTIFTDRVELRFHIASGSFDTLTRLIADATCGAVCPQQTGAGYYPFS